MPNDTVPLTALADALVQAAASDHLLFIDAQGSRLTALAALARSLADPALEVLVIPAWDSAPWDRVPPSAAVIGQRVEALAALAGAPAGRRLVLTSARALLQKVPPPAHWADAAIALRPGAAVDEAALRLRLATFGYTVDEQVD